MPRTFIPLFMYSRLLLAPLLLVSLLPGCTNQRSPEADTALAAPFGQLRLTSQASGTDALLQAVSVVDESTVWVSGHRGTVLRTTNGGADWERIQVPNADSLQFRDVHASSAREAWLLSAGTGEVSRVYHTTNGGASWRIVQQNTDSAGFYDCLDFWPDSRGIAFGDVVDGALVVLRTEDGSQWSRVPARALPDAQPDEGGFAASGSCVLTSGTTDGRGWIGTGNAVRARVLRTDDAGVSWQTADVPLPAGSGAGIVTLALGPGGRLYALGGDIGNPEAEPAPVAVSRDDGATWQLAGATPLSGAVYGSAAIPTTDGALVAVSPRGLALSRDGGETWTLESSESFWAVAFSAGGTGWAAGPRGALVRIDG